MSNELRTVRLYGRLGARFGRVHHLAVMSAPEAVQALCATVPEFERVFLADGARYACFLGKRNLGESDMAQPAGDEDIRIAPIIQGSKRGGLFQIILGAALVAGAFYTGGASLAAGGLAFSGAAGQIAFTLGVSLALGGVAQMLSPQQRGLSTRDNPENGASYNFNGPVNTTAQGNPVPVLYGELMVGSAVVSAGIMSEDQA